METFEKKFYKISEVVEILNIPASTLRFWERKFPFLKPYRNEGQTRFYTVSDIEKLRMIQFLLKEKGLKIDAAIEQMRNNSSGVSRKYETVERLKMIREKLNSLLITLNKMR